jgi:hypothetical protein
MTAWMLIRGKEVDNPTETLAELRQRVARASHHGLILIFDEAGQQLLALARELDARADAMESRAD